MHRFCIAFYGTTVQLLSFLYIFLRQVCNTMKYIDSIEQVKRRVMKMLPGMDNLSYKERIYTFKLPTFVYSSLRMDKLEVYKILHGIYDMKVSPCLTIRSSETSRLLRDHNMCLLKERSRSKLRSTSFTQRVVNSWNSLSIDVANAPSANSFKHRKKHI